MYGSIATETETSILGSNTNSITNAATAYNPNNILPIFLLYLYAMNNIIVTNRANCAYTCTNHKAG